MERALGRSMIHHHSLQLQQGTTHLPFTDRSQQNTKKNIHLQNHHPSLASPEATAQIKKPGHSKSREPRANHFHVHTEVCKQPLQHLLFQTTHLYQQCTALRCYLRHISPHFCFLLFGKVNKYKPWEMSRFV